MFLDQSQRFVEQTNAILDVLKLNLRFLYLELRMLMVSGHVCMIRYEYQFSSDPQFHLERANAEEFYEVYKGVVNEYQVRCRT